MTVSASSESAALAHLRHNLIFNVADGTWWLFGISFVSTATILPVYVSHLTTSAIVIGLVPALESLGWYLPQLFTAPFVEGLPRVKRALLTITLFERIPFLLIGAVIFLTSVVGGEPTLTLVLFFLVYGIRVFASGVSAIPWQELMARVIPTRQRGRFFAAQRVFGGIAGLVGAAAAAEILARFVFPINYALCFVSCFGAITVSYVCLAQTVEPRQAISPTRERVKNYWRELPAILRSDGNFRMYLSGRALTLLGSMAMAFFAVHAVQTFGLGDAEAAVFAAILIAANIVGSAAWGWLGDKRGQKLVLAASLWLYTLGLALAWLSDTLTAYYFVFCLAGLGTAGLLISDLALVLEFAPTSRRPTYMGIARGLLSPWVGLAPILGGVLLTQFGYAVMLVVSIVVTALGLLLVTVQVREPRTQQALRVAPVVDD
jgi:MFS family permease